ncbi:hypothetical protein C8E97_2789 [Saccharothrix australiensis]|uniref:Uncharacterized protein n=1 Tax=Saccharothrix australiensis TaxID=2072 RepID=A0A495W0F6_9PSEU|nr:hypothetical protein C8E97_2789 [Saccharothrix australiensis]
MSSEITAKVVDGGDAEAVLRMATTACALDLDPDPGAG